MPTFSDDEMQVTLGGHRYSAVPRVEDTSCTGCAFKSRISCRLAEAIYRADHTLPLGAPRCQEEVRKDQREIVWVPAHTVEG